MFRHLNISCANFSYLKLEGLVVGTSKYLFAGFSFWGMRGVQPVVPVIWRYFVNKLPSSLLNLRTSSLSSWNKSSTDSMNSNILNNTRTNIKHRNVLVYDRFAGLGIRSFPLSLFALSLKIALFKEQLWAIRSLQKSDASKLVSLLFKKEWRKWFACNLRFRSQKTSDLLDKIRIFDSFHCFSPFYAQERIAPVTLRSFALFQEGIAILLFCSQKMSDSLKNQRANAQPCRFGHICYLQVGWIFQLP